MKSVRVLGRKALGLAFKASGGGLKAVSEWAQFDRFTQNKSIL